MLLSHPALGDRLSRTNDEVDIQSEGHGNSNVQLTSELTPCPVLQAVTRNRAYKDRQAWSGIIEAANECVRRKAIEESKEVTLRTSSFEFSTQRRFIVTEDTSAKRAMKMELD